MAAQDEFGGVEVAELEDEFGGVAVEEGDEFGGVLVEEAPKTGFSGIDENPTQSLPPIKLSPYEEARVAGLDTSAMGDSSDLIRAVVNDPKGIPGAIAQGVMAPFSLAGQVINAGLQDAMTTVAGDPESGGNLYELLGNNAPGGPLPFQRTLAELSSTDPTIATTGKIASGLVESLPLLAVMPQGALGKLVAAGFTADMINHASEEATALGEEMGKPPEERDADRITSAISGIAQAAAFAPLTGAHAGGKAIGERVAPRREAIRELANQLKREPLDRPTTTPKPQRQIGVRIPEGENVLATPELQSLADRALQQGPNPPLARGEVSALEQIRQELNPPRIEGVEPTRVAERIEGGGEAPYGKTSFNRPAESPTTPRTQAARAEDVSLKLSDKEVSPAAARFIEEFQKPDGKITNYASDPSLVTTQNTGLGLRTIADLDALASLRGQVKARMDALREEGKAKMQAGDRDGAAKAFNESSVLAQKSQTVREAIETATNKGSWSEENATSGPVKRPMGERPLDWQKNPEVAEWLKKNGEQLGIDVSEIKTPTSLRAGEKFLDLTETPIHRDVVAEVNKLKQEFPGGLEIEVVDSYQKLPDSTHQAAYRQGANPAQVSGAVTGNKVYINSSNIGSIAEARQIFLHEQAGHFATDRILGKKLGNFMEQVSKSFEKDALMDEVRSRYKTADGVLLGREYVARLAENPQANPTAWNKIVAQFRSWLRDIGWVKEVTENDIRVLLSRATESLRSKEAGMTPEEVSLSLKTAAEKANERFPATKPAAASPPPPSGKPPTTATAVPSPSGRPAPKITLDDIYKIFEPEKKVSPSLKERGIAIAEAFRTGVSSKFRPVNKLAEDIAKSYGRTSSKDIAGIMEQLKGSQGKGEADVYRFDRDVSKLVEGSEKDFNAYMFLQRTLDRLNQDAADVAAGGKPRRSVSNYTVNDIGAKIRALESKVGPEKLRAMENAAKEYQRYMDDALKLQVESGRMSQEVYNEIKAGNQFYAPFKVMKYLEESSKPAGSGKRIDTTADFTKAMEGIEDPNFKLGDMLGAARQGILMSRILADKNTAMRNVAELAAFDTQGKFIKRLAPAADAPRGFEAVNVFENGKQNRYAVRPEVAEAIQLYGGNAGGVISRALGYSSIPFRAGATALNIPFQISNLLADQPRAALISKYGITNARNMFSYPLDFIHSLFASIGKDVFGVNSKAMFDFLDSGVAGTTIQEYLTPNALKFQEPTNISKSKKLASSVINTLPRFAQAIEQTSKVLGVKRAIRFEGVTDGKQLAKQVPEAITELRRFSGSPDFGRQGKWVEQARLNLLYMFLNARIQGAVADVGRLAGRDSAATAANTWLKIGTAVGIPTAYLYYLNQRPEFKDDYEKRPEQEKRNYWLIPKDTYITNDDGEKMRDYWRIPKREVSKWMANLTETALDFAQKRDPQAAADFGVSMIEELSPVTIQGDTAQERLESVAASLNPLLKAPLELASGRDLYRHRAIVPESMKDASPEQQFTPRTSESFKKLATAMPDVAPEFLRSPLLLENLTRNLTAGLLTQFMSRKPVEGRSTLENNPLLARFQALPYTDNTEVQKEIDDLRRVAADEQLERHRTAVKLIDENKNLELGDIVAKAPQDERLIKHLVDLWVAKQNGITAQERQILALPVRQRASYVNNQLRGLNPQQKEERIMDLGRKRILTEAVFQEMGEMQ